MADRNRTERLEIRVEEGEKEAFCVCAKLAGISTSSWVRERLRQAARRELIESGRQVPFVKLTKG